jgi:hypothetical protein
VKVPKGARAALNAIRTKLDRRHDVELRKYETMQGTPNEIDEQGGYCAGLLKALGIVEDAIADIDKAGIP